MRCAHARERDFNASPPTAMKLICACEIGRMRNRFYFKLIVRVHLRTNSTTQRTVQYIAMFELLKMVQTWVLCSTTMLCRWHWSFREAHTTVFRYVSGAVEGRLCWRCTYYEISRDDFILWSNHDELSRWSISKRECAVFGRSGLHKRVPWRFRVCKFRESHAWSPKIHLKCPAYQYYCMFCSSRGISRFSCPPPMRRRSAQSFETLLPCQPNNLGALWADTTNIHLVAPDHGSYLLNLFLVISGDLAQRRITVS